MQNPNQPVSNHAFTQSRDRFFELEAEIWKASDRITRAAEQNKHTSLNIEFDRGVRHARRDYFGSIENAQKAYDEYRPIRKAKITLLVSIGKLGPDATEEEIRKALGEKGSFHYPSAPNEGLF